MTKLLLELRPFNQFHHERPSGRLCLPSQPRLPFFQSVDRRDVRMIQRGEHFRLTLEARQAVRVSRQSRRQHFERHLSFQLGVSRSIHFAHSAGAEKTDDFIRAETRAGCQGQRRQLDQIVARMRSRMRITPDMSLAPVVHPSA